MNQRELLDTDDDTLRDRMERSPDLLLPVVRALQREVVDLAPGPEQLAREDAARDVARAWAAYVADWGRGTVERSVAAPLDRLAAAHGLQV